MNLIAVFLISAFIILYMTTRKEILEQRAKAAEDIYESNGMEIQPDKGVKTYPTNVFVFAILVGLAEVFLAFIVSMVTDYSYKTIGLVGIFAITARGIYEIMMGRMAELLVFQRHRDKAKAQYLAKGKVFDELKWSERRVQIIIVGSLLIGAFQALLTLAGSL